MRKPLAPTRTGALLGALAVLLAMLVLPALHPAHAAASGTAPALTAPGAGAGGECPVCRGLSRVRSAPAAGGVDLRSAAPLVLEGTGPDVSLPHSPARDASRARAPPAFS